MILPNVPEMASPSAVRAAIHTTAINARSRPYSASACPSSRSIRATSVLRTWFVVEISCPLLSFYSKHMVSETADDATQDAGDG